MAVIKGKDEEEQQGQMSTSGQSSVLGSGQQQGGQSTGSGWTNLQTYLSANEGQGAAVAGELTDGTQKDIDKGKSDTAAWKKQAEGQVQASTKKDDKGYLDTIKTGDVTKIDDGFNDWKKLSNYWGANDASEASGYNDVYSQQAKVKERVTGLQDYGTQKAGLQETYGKQAPGYTQGMGTLDAFIMRGDKSGKDKLQAFQDQNKNVGADLDQAVSGVNSSIAAAKQNNAYSSGVVNDAIAGRLKGYDDTLKDRNFAERDRQFFSNQKQIQDTYKRAGLEAPQDVAGYLNPNETDPYTWSSQAELDAINKLSGLDDDESTSARTRGNSSAYNINWNDIYADIGKGKAQSSNLAAAQATSGGGGEPSDIQMRNQETTSDISEWQRLMKEMERGNG